MSMLHLQINETTKTDEMTMKDQNFFPGFEPPPSKDGAWSGDLDAEIILLDYVQTLVENGSDPRRNAMLAQGKYAEWIEHEQFRPWLVELLKGRRVIVITARSRFYSRETLARIKAHGMKVEEVYFNPSKMEPPDAKRRILHEKIFPVHGVPKPGRYLALESNGKTRAMYADEGIPAMPVSYGEPWRSIPKVPAK